MYRISKIQNKRDNRLIDTLEDAGKIYLRGSDHILHFGGNISGDKKERHENTNSPDKSVEN